MSKVYRTLLYLAIAVFIIIIFFCNNYKKDDYFEFNSSENVYPTSNTNISESEVSKIKVYIIGEVQTNGVIELDSGARIEDAIILAGGPTDIADLSKVNLAYQLEDGQKIYIPSIYEKNEDIFISSDSGENIIEEPSGNNSTSKININKANLEELEKIPGVGKSTAQKIIDYRNENGNFKSIDDLKKVNGIGDKKYENLKEYICIK